MKKLIFFFSLALTGLMTSCVDKNEEVDADQKPSWLHGSIYEELKNPTSDRLTGTFNTYLHLVDDLGYAETLNRTGSKTVFPANDEAFERFFSSNDWGVTDYNQLTESQKKLLLYSSMLDNALLVDMLSNVSSGTNNIVRGMAVKHPTNMSVTDTVTHIYGPADMPNNKYWTKYYAKGIDVVRDATTPMMVHFTREQMVNNNITISGEESDFEIITGSPYSEDEKSTYIYENKILNRGDVTCMNGYIHQLENVLVPPGNMAQVIAKDKETSIFSHVLDYYAAPFYDINTTRNYNDLAVASGRPTIDSIFQVRYLSSRSQGSPLVIGPDNNTVSSTNVLSYDPGWNQYYPSVANSSGFDVKITDMGAMFVPDDEAIRNYFLPGGAGAFLIDIYGDKPNTAGNLIENLDSLQAKNPQVLTLFVRNLQKSSFVLTVPSKFTTIVNDASENMEMNISKLKQNASGKKYDVKIANNGIVYVLNEMLPPAEYAAVLAPASSYPDMQVMNWAVQDRTQLGVDFKFYLLAMGANYAFFIPDDNAFGGEGQLYVNPVTLGKAQPEALRFYIDPKLTPSLRVESYRYDPETNTVGDIISNNVSLSTVKSQLVDILNYHTVILSSDTLARGVRETIGENHYYKTKHGGEIYVSGGTTGATVSGGSQLDNGLEASTIMIDYTQKNGHAYRLDKVIQAPQNSVSKILRSDDRFSDFYEACSGFSATTLLNWCGISDVTNQFGTTPQDQYITFTSTYGTGNNKVLNACLDENVKMFNTYNYTLYAPNNDAMQKAYAEGLPRWSDIEALFNKYSHEDGDEDVSPEEERDQMLAYSMVKVLRDFVRYHFHGISLYADNKGGTKRYQTLCTDNVGVAKEVDVTVGNNKLVITDGTGTPKTIAADGVHMVNKMARDYWFDKQRLQATSITTSSFCAVHELTEPLKADNKRFDADWSTEGARAKAAKTYKRLKAENKL